MKIFSFPEFFDYFEYNPVDSPSDWVLGIIDKLHSPDQNGLVKMILDRNKVDFNTVDIPGTLDRPLLMAYANQCDYTEIDENILFHINLTKIDEIILKKISY